MLHVRAEDRAGLVPVAADGALVRPLARVLPLVDDERRAALDHLAAEAALEAGPRVPGHVLPESGAEGALVLAQLALEPSVHTDCSSGRYLCPNICLYLQIRYLGECLAIGKLGRYLCISPIELYRADRAVSGRRLTTARTGLYRPDMILSARYDFIGRYIVYQADRNLSDR